MKKLIPLRLLLTAVLAMFAEPAGGFGAGFGDVQAAQKPESRILHFDLDNNMHQLVLQDDPFTVRGAHDIQISTSSQLSPGTYTLSTPPAVHVTGNFQFDGGSALTAPALSQIRQFGGAFYRLTLKNSLSGEEVVVTPAPANIINIMPLGASITVGFNNQSSNPGGGYRSQLYQELVNDGRFTPNFVGSSTISGAGKAPSGGNVLTGANQIHHQGLSGATTGDVLVNLIANKGNKGNNGGFYLAPGNGVNPDYVVINVGGNDYVYNRRETIGPVHRLDAIVTRIETLRPEATVVLSNLLYRKDAGALEDSRYNPFVTGVVYNHVLAGHHVVFADAYNGVTPNDSIANLAPPDNSHPTTPGYALLGRVYFNAIVYGSAYWTGHQGSRWNAVRGGNATNFAQDYRLRTDRRKAVDASTDVYFNHNAAPLPTTLGQDTSVRSVNFAAGAAGAVTIGGGNNLSIGSGGITVQKDTGAHAISANVFLGADQTWGNVSRNPFTVSGMISGAHSLKVAGAYSIEIPAPTGDATHTQTYSGTGAIVLSGPNTYSGGTTVSSGTLLVTNTSGSATGTGAVSVASGATLTNNGRVGGDVNVRGTVNGNGTFDGAITVGSGGTFSAAAAVNGALNAGRGGLIDLSAGTLKAGGGIVNDGTVRLRAGTQLVLGPGATFTNNGTLDMVSGSFSMPAGFINNGVVFDSSVVKARSVNLAGGTLTVTVDGVTGHTYQLQRGDALTDSAFANIGMPQGGTTGAPLAFTDDHPTATQRFYRVRVTP